MLQLYNPPGWVCPLVLCHWLLLLFSPLLLHLLKDLQKFLFAADASANSVREAFWLQSKKEKCCYSSSQTAMAVTSVLLSVIYFSMLQSCRTSQGQSRCGASFQEFNWFLSDSCSLLSLTSFLMLLKDDAEEICGCYRYKRKQETMRLFPLRKHAQLFSYLWSFLFMCLQKQWDYLSRSEWDIIRLI